MVRPLFIFGVASLAIVFSTARFAHASIVVDPNVTGATNVIQDPDGSGTPLVNPLSDPLDLGTTALAIGRAASGGLAVIGGGELTSGLSTIGMNAGSDGLVRVEGTGSVWNIDTGESYDDALVVGSEGVGNLSISGGAWVYVNGQTYLGNETGSTGNVTVDGAGSLWTNVDDLYVGNDGIAELEISNAGQMVSQDYVYVGYESGSEGNVSVDGLGSTWTIEDYFYLGYDGTAEMSITNGGRVATKTARIGHYNGSNGVATIDGPGSKWLVDGSIDIAGYQGTGELTIQNSGFVSSEGADLGDGANSHGLVTVTGDNSTWQIVNTTTIGRTGTGELAILDQAIVTSESAYVGYFAGSNGTVTLDGDASLWVVAEDLIIGRAGHGAVEVRNSASANVAGDVWIGQQQLGSQLIMEGTTLTAGSLLTAAVDLVGTGTVNTGGLVSDIDVTFDASHGLQQQFLVNQLPGQNITVNLDQSQGGALGAGFAGTGSLSIADGRQVESSMGVLGWRAGSNGTARVEGTGSQWTIRGDLDVGQNGTGALTVRAGGVVDVQGTTSVDPLGISGQITLDGGMLRTGSLEAAVTDLHGGGTIETKGIVSDLDLVFDTGHGLEQQIDLIGVTGQDIQIQLFQSTNRSLGAGYKGTGSLLITDNQQVRSGTATLGWQEGSMGTGRVTGIGSAWNINGNLYVGRDGEGTLEVVDNGRVTSFNSTIGAGPSSVGHVTIEGVVASWGVSGSLAIGGRGAGSLRLADGAHATARTVEIASMPGSMGEAIIQGGGTEWTIDNGSYFQTGFFVGREGNGSFRVLDGARVTSNPAAVGGYRYGYLGTGTVEIDGAGSSWTVRNYPYSSSEPSLAVGYYQGTMNITRGGRVASGRAQIGGDTLYGGQLGMGVVNVDGPGSVWTVEYSPTDYQHSISIGLGGHGALNILNGGIVASGPAAIGYSSYSSPAERNGKVTVDGNDSVWLVGRSQAVGFQIGQGTLDITNGGQVISGGATIQQGGTVTVGGDGATWLVQEGLVLSGRMYSFGDTEDNTLTILDGGLISVAGDVTIESGFYNDSLVEFGLAAEGQGRLEVDGMFHIRSAGGISKLNLTLEEEINLMVGDVFELIVADGGIDGTFTQLPMPVFSAGFLFDWTVHYNPNNISVQVASSVLAGDFNEDGTVDAMDLDAWKSNYGLQSGATHARGDADGDGVVDGSDFLIWQTQFGRTFPEGVSVVVPEPTAIFLSLFAVAPLVICRNRLAARPAVAALCSLLLELKNPPDRVEQRVMSAVF